MKQRYDSYKPSGIDWIGEIPSHWSICTLKQGSTSIRNGYVGPTKDILVEAGIPYFQSLHVKEGKLLFDRGEYFVTKEWADKHPKIYKDDIVIVQTGDIGQVAIVPPEYDGCNCHALIIVVSDKTKIKPSYLLYYLRSSIGKELMLLTKTGATLPHLNSGSICNTELIVPPLAEQEAIAAWLDTQCGEIDAAIAKVDREIELIDELKQSEISRFVTRGLNPDAPLRPSGIDWIGEVPEHWHLVPLKSVVSYNDEVWPETTDQNTEISYVEIGDVSQENGIENYSDYSFKDAPSRARRITRKDDVIISTVRTYLRAIARIKRDGLTVSTGFMVLRAKSINPKFLSYAVLNDFFIQEIIAKSTGVSYPAINSTDVSNIKILFPPLSEQQTIADYLDKKCAEIDGLKERLMKKRETLKELRQAIISEVVTGKRKVI